MRAGGLFVNELRDVDNIISTTNLPCVRCFTGLSCNIVIYVRVIVALYIYTAQGNMLTK